MPSSRKRPQSEFDSTQAGIGPQMETLDSLIGGYNGYVDPSVLSPQFWAAASNVYAGQFQTIRRARWAPVLNTSTISYAPSGQRITTMFGLAPVGLGQYVIFDNGNLGAMPINIWAYGAGVTFPTPQSNIFTPANLAGPFQRYSTGALLLQANGIVRSKMFYAAPFALPGGTVLQFWGIDTPDSSPQITTAAASSPTIAAAPTGAVRLSNIVTILTTAPHGFFSGEYVTIAGVTDTTFNSAAGTAQLITVTGASTFTFVQVGPNTTSGSGSATLGLTKTVGRSYSWSWENSNSGHVSAPSPASQYVKYTGQVGTIDLVQVGTVAAANGSATVNGTNTQFTAAWVGRGIWIQGGGTHLYNVQSVSSPTVLTLDKLYADVNVATSFFQIYDQQSTNIRLYATGDGGAVYFRIARNVFHPLTATVAAAGLEFVDTANSEPPNAPFTSEIAQNFNVPPPIGNFLQDYQGRILVYGVLGAPQSLFYSNMETTVVGQPMESFAPLNQITMPIGDGALKAMANLPTGMIMWSNHQDMFKLTGLLTDNSVANQFQLGATIQRLPYKIGAGSAFATAVTSLGAFWLSSDREVWLFTDHYAPKNVGKPIQDILNRINGTRLQFARMKNYKAGDRNWLLLALALDGSTFNNKLCALDLDLLASNGQASFFTFDMATNQPTWYLYDINCESIEAAIDSLSINHLLTSDVDLITDVDWQPAYYTVSAEQNVPAPFVRLHALGNENPEVVKTMMWLRAMTNQLPSQYVTQVWSFAVVTYDDDTTVLGNPANTGNVINLVPGTQNPSGTRALEYSPALFKFGSRPVVKGRRFQIQANFPTTPGAWELRGFQVKYTNVVAR